MRTHLLTAVLIGLICLPAFGAAKPAQAEEGFVSLFDGKTLEGWVGSTKGYGVEDGAIVCKTGKGGGGNLYTAKEYANFVLRFEFQLTSGANNGLGIRAPLKGNAAYAGMELQVLDNSAERWAKLKDYQYHASVYGVAPAKRGHLKPVGEWNTQEVTCNGRRVKVVLNGAVILDVDLDEVSANGTLDKRPHPGLKRTTGHIGFLGHGSRVAFRNLRIRELPATAAPAAGPIAHEIMVADSGLGKILKFSAEGKCVWQCDAPSTYDVQVLENGNILFPYTIKKKKVAGVKEVTPDKKVVWEYKTTGEVFTCQRLADGNTMVGECTNELLVEVDPKGKVVKKIKVKAKKRGHGTMRIARKTPAGTYVVGHVGDGVVREYNASGKVIFEFDAPGPAYAATRLANGNTLISCKDDVIEVNPKGKTVWHLKASDIPEMGPKWMSGTQRLPNGNTVICNWLGHHQEGKGVPIFEVTPDKKVVWTFTDTTATKWVSGVQILK